MSHTPLIVADGFGLPIRERACVTAQLASQYTGISRSRIYELLADGTLEGKVIRGRRVVMVESLLRLVGEAPSAKRAVPVLGRDHSLRKSAAT